MERRGNRFIDLTGMKFGKLTVVEFIERKNNSTFWKCKCDCGKETIAITSNLRSGHTVSCGCFKFESRNSTHGMRHTRLYQIWTDIKTRCYNKGYRDYKNYGGRGIKMCPEWLGEHGFENFSEWAYSTGYDENAKRGECTIDRIDVNGYYEPSNCRWADMMKQQNNRRNNFLIQYKGETKTLAEWSRELNLNYKAVRKRIRERGWNIEDAFEIPIGEKRME